MRKYVYLLVALLFSVSACSNLQEAIDIDDYDFLGIWDSDVYVLEIYQNGRGVYNTNQNRAVTHVEGRVIITNSELKFRGEGGNVSLFIDERPYQVTDPGTGAQTTRMIIEGVELIRISL